MKNSKSNLIKNNNKTNNKTFILYIDDFEYIKQLPNQKAGILLKNLFLYVKNKENFDCKEIEKDEILSIIFNAIKSKIDRDKEAYEVKCIKLRANASKRKQKEANASKCRIDNDIDIDIVSDIDIDKNINKKEKNIKKEKFSEFKNVFLTKDEYNKLIQIYKGNHDLEKAFSILGSYKASKGKTYKSDYAVLCEHNWVYKKVFENTNPKEKKSQMEKNRERM